MPTLKTVEIVVGDEYELPLSYSQDAATNEEILTLGAFLYEQMTVHRANASIKELEKQKEQELSQHRQQIAKIRADAAAKYEILEKQIAENEATTAMKQYQLLEAQKAKDAAIHKGEKEDLIKQHTANVRALTNENSTLEAQKRALEARCSQIVVDRDKDIEAAIERNNEGWKTTLEEKDNTISMLRNMLDNNMSSLQESFTKFYEENLKRSFNSRNKGAEYENFLASKLKLHYGSNPSFSHVEKSKSSSGHEADIIMTLNEKSVLWEAKNYSNPVDKTQVEKFLRDMKTNPYIKIGVMMSRYTTITGKANRGDFYTERDGDQLYIYVSNADTFGDSLYQLLPHLWQSHWETISKNVRNEDDERDKVIRSIDKLIEKIAKRKTEWVGIKSSFTKGLNWMTDEIDADEVELKKVLRLLKSGEKEKPVDTVWDSFFTESENDEYNDIIVIIKKICVPDEESIIKLNDFAENIRNELPEPKPSVDTIKKRLTNVLIPTAINKQKGRDTLVNGIKMKTG